MTKFDLSSFLVGFFDEANNRLQMINQKLVLLENKQLDDSDLVQLRRDIHTIKGSAQMFSVQDVSDVCHIIEDVLNAITAAKTNTLPMVQFLFDLHDALQARLKYKDAKIRLNVALKQQTYEQLKQQLDAAEACAKDKKMHPLETMKPLRRKKKKNKISKNLIAAVMGSIEVSLDKTKTTEKNTKKKIVPQTKKATIIDFRPNITALNMTDIVASEVSGSYLRVDRTRLSDLSNQIVELVSIQIRDDSPEQQLQRIIHDFRMLKDKTLSNQRNNVSTKVDIQVGLDHHLRQLQKCHEILRQQQLRSSHMLHDVRDQVLGLMLRPLHGVFSVFPRTVRDIAKRYHKKVKLVISGDSVEMDQVSAEALTEPLIHLINNAIAHGIETPEQRLANGKPDEGQITIHAMQKGNLIHLDVIDDGQGIDVADIKSKAMSQGLITATDAEEMDDSEIQDLIFSPGFSTKQEVTELAGRGMGMSVVLEVMHELTGNIHVYSQKGKGARFSMIFPASLTVQQGQSFRIAQQQFIIPSNLIANIIALKGQAIEIGSGSLREGFIVHNDHRTPMIDLRPVMGGVKHDPATEQSKILIVEHGEGFLAVIVDELLLESEIMVREIDPYLKRYQPVGLMGYTIGSDGLVQILLDPNGLKELCRKFQQ